MPRNAPAYDRPPLLATFDLADVGRFGVVCLDVGALGGATGKHQPGNTIRPRTVPYILTLRGTCTACVSR